MEQINRDKIRIQIKQQNSQQRKGDRQEKSQVQNGAGTSQIPSGSFAGYKTGDGDLGSGCGQRIADVVDGKNHLINADALGTDGTAQEYLIKETYETRNDACGRENQSAGYQRVFLFLHSRLLPYG